MTSIHVLFKTFPRPQGHTEALPVDILDLNLVFFLELSFQTSYYITCSYNILVWSGSFNDHFRIFKSPVMHNFFNEDFSISGLFRIRTKCYLLYYRWLPVCGVYPINGEGGVSKLIYAKQLSNIYFHVKIRSLYL